MLSPLQCSDLALDVGDEQLVAVALSHRQHLLETIQFRLLLLVQNGVSPIVKHHCRQTFLTAPRKRTRPGASPWATALQW